MPKMPRNKVTVRPAPSGMDIMKDIPSLTPSVARRIFGFYPARHSVLEQTPAILPFRDTVNIDGDTFGLALWQDLPSTPLVHRKDYVIVARSTAIYAHLLANTTVYSTITRKDVGPGIYLGSMEFANAENTFGTWRLRSAQYRDELFIVQDIGGSKIKRIVRDPSTSELKMLPCGIDTPAAPTVSDGGAGALTGAYKYVWTWEDEKGRESSPSPAGSISVTSRQVLVQPLGGTANWSSQATTMGVAAINIYRTLNGGSVYFRVNHNPTQTVSQYTDNNSDASISANQVAPNPGQNDPPTWATILTIHRGRLIANDRTSVANPLDYESHSSIQVSNLDAPTQFAPIPVVATDGARLSVSGSSADDITGLMTFGSVLGVWTLDDYFQLWGDSFEDWAMHHVTADGCVSHDTITQCGEKVLYLSQDGPVAINYLGGTFIGRLGGEIKGVFTGYERGLFAPPLE